MPRHLLAIKFDARASRDAMWDGVVQCGVAALANLRISPLSRPLQTILWRFMLSLCLANAAWFDE